jgi:reductive dehalogenase
LYRCDGTSEGQARGEKVVDALVFVEALFLLAAALLTFSFVISSIWEREKRAVLIGGVIFLVLMGGGIGLLALRTTGFFRSTTGVLILVVGLVTSLAVLLLTVRIGRNPRAQQGTEGYIVGNVARFDEREQVFSRGYLSPNSEQYRTFYDEHPEWEEKDASRREKGVPMGLPGRIDKPHEGPNVAAFFASFSMPHHLGSPGALQPRPSPFFGGNRMSLSPAEATERVKGLALHLGANLVGITQINPLWIYAARGQIKDNNWGQWGSEIELSQSFAIVFAMEMSRDMVWAAPHTPTVVESGVVYAKGAFIATELAAYVANLGYSATANHLQRYDLLLVPLAADAGLGEVGRLGLLMTKEFGPRVRLGCVTTDLSLVPNRPVDIGVEDFCKVCKKCAHCCPSRSIPFDDPQEVNGVRKWKLKAETCFAYWARNGTDCCLCMRVCPWSHPRTAPHRLITELVSRNRVARPIFSWMDDLFYGKSPKTAPAPKWAEYGEW